MIRPLVKECSRRIRSGYQPARCRAGVMKRSQMSVSLRVRMVIALPGWIPCAQSAENKLPEMILPPCHACHACRTILRHIRAALPPGAYALLLESAGLSLSRIQTTSSAVNVVEGGGTPRNLQRMQPRGMTNHAAIDRMKRGQHGSTHAWDG